MRLLILWVFAWGNPVFADDLFTPIVKGMQSFLSGLMSIQATATPDQKLVGSFLNPLTSGGSLTGLASASVAQPQGYDKVLTLKFSFQDPKVKDVLINNSTYQEMSVPGLTNRANVGSPMIPYKYTYALIPDGYEVVAVDNQYQQQQEIKNLLLLPEQAALPMATTSSAVFAFNAQAYKDNNPVAPVLTESIQILHRYHLLPILLTPVQYRAVDRVVSYAKGMTVRIYLKKKTTVLQLSVAEEQLKNKIKNRRSAQKSVLGLIENPSDLAPEAQSVAKSLGVQGQTVTSSYDMVIIGPESYRSSVADYISFKASLGQRVYFASMTADIASQNGTDLPMKIRNYITYAYNTYGIQYVLLAGDITKVPARDNIPNYYDVKAIYSDVYYSCLDGTWDENNNGIYGETTDNAMDRLAEVYVGRFAASNTTDLTKMFNKTKTYLSLSPTSSFLKTVSVLGENMDTNNPPETSGTLYDNYMGNIFNNDNKFIAIQHGVYADSANFTNEANSNAAQLYMHDGHGNTNIDMLLTDSDITEGKFSNTLPFIVYSSGCFANNFLNSGAISRYFLQISHGALAFIGNTNYGWYSPGVANGASNVYQAEFYNQVVSGSPQLGKAIALAREKETTSLFYSTDHYGLRDLFFCINLLGDPSVPLRQYNSDIVIPEIQSITYSVGTNCFSASWTITEDVAEYQYSIGTEVNSDNVLPWTTINTANIDQISVVLLSDYTNIFNVKAKNTDGVWSNVASKTLYFLPDITSPSIPTG